MLPVLTHPYGEQVKHISLNYFTVSLCAVTVFHMMCHNLSGNVNSNPQVLTSLCAMVLHNCFGNLGCMWKYEKLVYHFLVSIC